MKAQNCSGLEQRYPWVVVVNPGTDEEELYKAFETFADAHYFVSARVCRGAHLDIMKRLPDGTLTCEF